MSWTTELRFWPSPLGGLAWSQDCELAIAVNEMVQLLVSLSFKIFQQQPASPWHIVNLATSLWTSTELPLKYPAPFGTFSVGEEISASAVVSLEWSPPGISKHRRSALAVLTSNLVLSLWAPESSPKVPASWERRLIVNDCIEPYLGNFDRNETYDNEEERMDKRRLRMRLRSFTWCSTNPDRGLSSNIGSRLHWGPYILAMSNDDNQVLFVSVESPYTSVSSDQGWKATVIGHFSLGVSEPVPYSTAVFEDFIQQQRCVSHLAWSPWSHRGDGRLDSVLSYASNDKLYARNIVLRIEDDSQTRPDILVVDNETKYHDITLRYGGPLSWCPKVCDQHHMYLVAFSRLEVFSFTVSNCLAQDFKMSSTHLEQNWDPISGVTFTFKSPQEVHMYYSYYMSTTQVPAVGLRLPIADDSKLPLPSWQETERDTQAYFSAANDLAGNAFTKVWGLALSPLGDLFATLSTRHPSDMMEYLTVAEQSCTLTISNPRGSHGHFNIASGDFLGSVSSEAACFSINRWFGYNNETPEQVSVAIIHISDQLMQSFGAARPQEVVASIPTASININNNSGLTAQVPTTAELIERLRQDVFFNPKTIKDRHEILVSRVCAPHESTEFPHLKLSRVLAEAVLKLPISICDNSPLGQRMLATFALVLDKLHEIGGGVLLPSDAPDFDAPETCTICDSPIRLESLDWARCKEGHQFTRCSLSFLAIQGPNISKFCGICRAQYLKEEYIAREDQASQDRDGLGGGDEGDQELPDAPDVLSASVSGNSKQMSLARILFSACDVCVYCGGKFVG
ncbi:uncharacterized protein BDZ99DRAFT_420176 [Mytilinidion resinicola]|uniref:Transcription factor IIIC putative zinc-finger domain-containing protein n=1 Tax=Mytilinidion resinicola TaxID=574789 RepID=A0A6A6YFY2_9PEZI|nr:uncharacterized protein BDZ99DRAFT_420176 [Mytilinidion resinicola]KAF2807711.1 hypothetical protein BDZ99DRAFT_420176 [Mytilinidion resinicola]